MPNIWDRPHQTVLLGANLNAVAIPSLILKGNGGCKGSR